MNDIKCLLVSMGIGFVVGSMVTASNKKVQDIMKQAKQMAEEKYDIIKEGVVSAKEKIEEKMEEISDENNEYGEDVLVKNKKNKRS